MLTLWILSLHFHTMVSMCYTAMPVVETLSEISELYPEHASTPVTTSPTIQGILRCFSRSHDLRTAQLNRNYNLSRIPARVFSAWPETKVGK